MLTLSLLAKCDYSGQIGAITFSDRRAGGAFIPAIRPGVGACAVQGAPNPAYHKTLLGLMEKGLTPEEAVLAVLARDRHAAHRQILALDAFGVYSVRTGKKVSKRTGQKMAPGYCVAGTGLPNTEMLDSIAHNMETTARSDLPLGNRLLGALEEARIQGLEMRGEPQSAAILIYGDEDYAATDLRVDSARDAIMRLRHLYDLYQGQFGAYRNAFPSKSAFGVSNVA